MSYIHCPRFICLLFLIESTFGQNSESSGNDSNITAILTSPVWIGILSFVGLIFIGAIVYSVFRVRNRSEREKAWARKSALMEKGLNAPNEPANIDAATPSEVQTKVDRQKPVKNPPARHSSLSETSFVGKSLDKDFRDEKRESNGSFRLDDSTFPSKQMKKKENQLKTISVNTINSIDSRASKTNSMYVKENRALSKYLEDLDELTENLNSEANRKSMTDRSSALPHKRISDILSNENKGAPQKRKSTIPKRVSSIGGYKPDEQDPTKKSNQNKAEKRRTTFRPSSFMSSSNDRDSFSNNPKFTSLMSLVEEEAEK
jgi:hypothetical protein